MIGMKISGLPIGLRIRLIFCLAVFGCLGVPITATAAPEDMTPEQMNDAIGLPFGEICGHSPRLIPLPACPPAWSRTPAWSRYTLCRLTKYSGYRPRT